MTEAELQSNVSDIIVRTFPSFQGKQIYSQRSFSIKFGHHNVVVNGKKPGRYAKRGIYDILVLVDAKPLILFELKRPGIALTTEDIDQGVSYARLTDPITPITVVSNGNDTKVINTLSKQEFTKDQLGSNFLATIEQGLQVAESEAKDSFRLLVAKDQDVLFDVIKDITESERAFLTGTADNWSRPLIDRFQVPRSAMKEFRDNLLPTPYKLLSGDALVGKTNFLFQYIEKEHEDSNACLYLDARKETYPVLQKLANHLTKLLSYPITMQDVRNWLIIHFSTDSQYVITLIYDHLQPSIPNTTITEIAELADIFSGSKNRIILAVDSANVESLVKEKERSAATSIGRLFKKFTLKGFDTLEYGSANNLLQTNYNAGVLPGGVYSYEYRTPRLWRVLIASFDRPDIGYVGIIPSIQGIEFLKLCRDCKEISRELKIAFIKLIAAYVESIPRYISEPPLRLQAVNISSIPEESLLSCIDKTEISRIMEAGLLEKRPYGDLEWLYVPKIPELLAGYATDYLKQRYAPLMKCDSV